MTYSESQVEEVFFAALEIRQSDDRALYLENACRENASLRKRVQQLLDAHPQVGSFLQAHSPVELAELPTFAMQISEGPGTEIGRYKLLERIGEGGFGVVFMAEQTRPLRRKVALKVLKPGMDSRQIIARFEAERQALALMNHPNIARVLEAGETDSGRPYFVMELVKGIPITEFCEQACLAQQDRLRLLVAVCRAVQHAHQKGVIHRDLKPSNVLVTVAEGEPMVKVIDFGIAKAMGQQLTEKTLFTGFCQMIGTPLYMSPEQASLSSVDVDTRSDVYSLGILLYELLTGSTPIDKETFSRAGFDQIRRMICEDEPETVSVRMARTTKSKDAASGTSASSLFRFQRFFVPKLASRTMHLMELDWIAMRALEKDRNRRYDSANALANDIERFLNGQPVEACPPSVLYRLRKIANKNRAALTTVGLVVASLVLGITISTWQAIRATYAESLANEQRELADSKSAEAARSASVALAAQREAIQQREAVTKNLYYANLRSSLVDWNNGNVARFTEKLLSHLPQDGQNDLRDWEWYYLLGLGHKDERTLFVHSARLNAVSWSPDGRYIATASQDGKVGIHDTTTWEVHWSSAFGAAFSAQWSPDSQRVLWQIRDIEEGVYVMQVGTWETRRLGPAPSSGIAWHRNGRDLIYLLGDGTAEILDVTTNKRSSQKISWNRIAKIRSGQLIVDHANIESSPPVDGAGKSRIGTSEETLELAACIPDPQESIFADKGRLRLLLPEKRSLASDWHAGQTGINCVVVSPDGLHFASGDTNGLIRIWNARTGTLTSILQGHRSPVRTIAWDPKGHRLVAGDANGLVKIWSLETSSQPQEYTGHAGGVRSIAWKNNDRTLISAGINDGKMAEWHNGNSEPVTVQALPGVREFSLNPMGELNLLILSTDESPNLFVQAGEKRTAVQSIQSPTMVKRFLFSMDGQKLAALYGGKIEVVDLHRNRLDYRWSGANLRAAAWSPDGHLLAVAGQGDATGTGARRYAAWVHLLDPEKQTRVARLRHGENWSVATAIAWDATGNRLASADDDGLVEVWRFPDQVREISVRLHSTSITALAWSPNGLRVASACKDGSVCIWDSTSGEELLMLETPNFHVTQLKWSPDGKQLAGITSGDAIKVWDASAGYQLASNKEIYFENLERQVRVSVQKLAQGRKDEALAELEKWTIDASSRNGTLPRWVTASLLLRATSVNTKTEEALALFGFLLRVHAADSRIHEEYADTLLKNNMMAQTEFELLEAVRLDSSNGRAHYALAAVLSRKGAHDAAFASIRAAMRSNFDNVFALCLLGDLYAHKAQWTEAIEHYRSAIQLKGTGGQAENNLAWLLANCPDNSIRNPAEAVELAKIALDIGPEVVKGFQHNTLGVSLYRTGNYQEAIEHLEKSESHSPGAYTHLNALFLSMSHWQLENKDEARKWLHKAIEQIEKESLQDGAEAEELNRFRAEAEKLLAK